MPRLYPLQPIAARSGPVFPPLAPPPGTAPAEAGSVEAQLPLSGRGRRRGRGAGGSAGRSRGQVRSWGTAGHLRRWRESGLAPGSTARLGSAVGDVSLPGREGAGGFHAGDSAERMGFLLLFFNLFFLFLAWKLVPASGTQSRLSPERGAGRREKRRRSCCCFCWMGGEKESDWREGERGC